ADAGLEAQAAAVASFLGAAVAIEGPRGEALAVHAAPARAEARSDAARYLGHPERVALRVSLADLGSLAILGEGPPSELQRVVTARVAGLLALSIGRERAGRTGREGRGRGEALPAGGPPWVVLMARQLLPGVEASAAAREAARERLRRLAPARRLLLRGDVSSLEYRLALAPEARDPRGLAVGARMADLLGRTVAASRPFADPEQRALAEAEARATLEAFEALGRPPQVARADRLPLYRLLGNLHNLPDGQRQAEELLAPLLTGRASAQAQRLDTLRAVLEAPDLVRAATRLGVHRNTLAYRLGRIEAQTGWQLDEPDLRFLLGLALRLMRDAQHMAPDERPAR
ncbi:MAG: PucR family transcriptional regulator, partial [Candidatus Limnocylindrales bacterium]